MFSKKGLPRKQIKLCLLLEEADKLTELAKQEKVSLSCLLRNIIRDYLNNLG